MKYKIKPKISEYLIITAIALAQYVLFFYPLLSSTTFIAGSDPEHYFYPSRYYLYESLKEGRFPFWTEKIYAGFPIYADSERSYLNPINIAATLIFGPLASYKVLHLGFYILGSLSLYFFLKRKGFGYLGFMTANLVYYFSFFHLFRQQHFNFTLTTYLLPFGLYLADTFLAQKRLKHLAAYAVTASLLTYFGSFQSVFIFMIGTLLYLFIYLKEELKVLKSAVILFLTSLLILSLSLPLLLPSAQLFLKSVRSVNEITYTEGSFNPLMIVNVFYPYFFQNGANYKWNMADSGYFIHETYVYLGISSLILAFLGFIQLNDKKMKLYITSILFLFFILGFIGFIPILKSVEIPPFSLFRYWGRSVILFALVSAYLCGYFIENYAKGRLDIKRGVIYAVFPVLYFLFLTLINLNTHSVRQTFSLLRRGAFTPDKTFVLWAAFLGLTVISALISLRKKYAFVSVIFCLIVIADLYYFGREPAQRYFRPLSDFYPKEKVEKSATEKNSRLVYFDGDTYHNKGLYYASWGVLGYSQYVPYNYYSFAKQYNVKDLEKLNPAVEFEFFKKAGVHKAVSTEGDVVFINSSYDLFEPFDGETREITRNEGILEWNITSSKKQTIFTKIKNYPGWMLYLNGTKIPLLSKNDDLFLNFNIPQGTSRIKLTFVPLAFYTGIAISLILSPLVLVLLKKALARQNIMVR